MENLVGILNLGYKDPKIQLNKEPFTEQPECVVCQWIRCLAIKRLPYNNGAAERTWNMQ